MKKHILTAVLAYGLTAISAAAQATDAPKLVIVSQDSDKTMEYQAIAGQLGLDGAIVNDLDRVRGLGEDTGDAIVLEYALEAPNQEDLSARLQMLGALPHRLTYMLFAETAQDFEPIAGLEAPDNVKLVIAVKALDRAVVAKSHAAADTGYDGARLSYDTHAAVQMAAQQLQAAAGSVTLPPNAKGWDAGAQYMLFESDVVRSGAPAEAVVLLRDYTSQNAQLRQTWYDIQASPFSKQLPRATDNDMYGVYVGAIGKTCGSSYPWDEEVPPQIYHDLADFLR